MVKNSNIENLGSSRMNGWSEFIKPPGYGFFCAKVAPQWVRVLLGGQTVAEQQAASKQARFYFGLAELAAVVGMVSLTVLIGAGVAAASGVLASNGIGSSLLAAYGQGITAQQLITYGSIGVGGAALCKLSARLVESISTGREYLLVNTARYKNWYYTPSCMEDYDYYESRRRGVGSSNVRCTSIF